MEEKIITEKDLMTRIGNIKVKYNIKTLEDIMEFDRLIIDVSKYSCTVTENRLNNKK